MQYAVLLLHTYVYHGIQTLKRSSSGGQHIVQPFPVPDDAVHSIDIWSYYEKHVAINISMHVHTYNVHGTVYILATQPQHCTVC